MVRTYSPKKVSVSFAGQLLSGFSEGSFITAERDEDAFSKVVGNDGETTRQQNPNRSGSVNVNLKGSSSSNDVLSALASKDEIDGSGVAPLIVKDNNGTTLVAGQAWIRKSAAVEYSREVGDRDWAFDVAEMTHFVGGNSQS